MAISSPVDNGSRLGELASKVETFDRTNLSKRGLSTGNPKGYKATMSDKVKISTEALRSLEDSRSIKKKPEGPANLTELKAGGSSGKRSTKIADIGFVSKVISTVDEKASLIASSLKSGRVENLAGNGNDKAMERLDDIERDAQRKGFQAERAESKGVDITSYEGLRKFGNAKQKAFKGFDAGSLPEADQLKVARNPAERELHSVNTYGGLRTDVSGQDMTMKNNNSVPHSYSTTGKSSDAIDKKLDEAASRQARESMPGAQKSTERP